MENSNRRAFAKHAYWVKYLALNYVLQARCEVELNRRILTKMKWYKYFLIQENP